MPRRYPRLLVHDHSGALVAIPLSIAPRLLPEEEFVSFSQEKVLEIAKTNERLEKRNNDMEMEIEQNTTNTTTNTTTNITTTTTNESDEETSDTSSEEENETIALTNSPPAQSTTSKQTVSNRDSSTETSLEHKRAKGRRLWSSEEDEIVLRAVKRKEPGRKLLERLPHRSRSAVMQRFYKMKDMYLKGLVRADDEDVEMEDEAIGKNREGTECGETDMDEIAPL